MRFVNLLILIVLLSGCSFTRFVDKKGRDCTQNWILLFVWDSCEEEKEPLATTVQEIKLDADINQQSSQ